MSPRLLILYTFLWWSGVVKWNNLCGRHFRCTICAACMVNFVGRNVSVYYIQQHIFVSTIFMKYWANVAQRRNVTIWVGQKCTYSLKRLNVHLIKCHLMTFYPKIWPILGVDVQSVHFGSKCPKEESPGGRSLRVKMFSGRSVGGHSIKALSGVVSFI